MLGSRLYIVVLLLLSPCVFNNIASSTTVPTPSASPSPSLTPSPSPAPAYGPSDTRIYFVYDIYVRGSPPLELVKDSAERSFSALVSVAGINSLSEPDVMVTEVTANTVQQILQLNIRLVFPTFDSALAARAAVKEKNYVFLQALTDFVRDKAGGELLEAEVVEEFTLGPQPSKPIVRFDYDMVVEGTPNRMEIYDTVHFSLNAMLPRSAFQTEVVMEHGSQGEGLSDLYNEVEEGEGSDTEAEEGTENEADNGEEASTEGGDGSARRLRGEIDVQIRRSLAMESSFFVSYSVVCLDDESARDIMTLMSERHYQVEKIVTDFLRDRKDLTVKVFKLKALDFTAGTPLDPETSPSPTPSPTPLPGSGLGDTGGDNPNKGDTTGGSGSSDDSGGTSPVLVAIACIGAAIVVVAAVVIYRRRSQAQAADSEEEASGSDVGTDDDSVNAV